MKNRQQAHLFLQIKGIALSVNGSVCDPRSLTGVLFTHWQLHQKLSSGVFVFRELCAHWTRFFSTCPWGFQASKGNLPLICHIPVRAVRTWRWYNTRLHFHPPKKSSWNMSLDCYDCFHFHNFYVYLKHR